MALPNRPFLRLQPRRPLSPEEPDNVSFRAASAAAPTSFRPKLLSVIEGSEGRRCKENSSSWALNPAKQDCALYVPERNFRPHEERTERVHRGPHSMADFMVNHGIVSM